MKMFKIISARLFFLFVFFAVCLGADAQDGKITVAVAANAQFALEDIAAAFKADTGVEVDLIINSSGSLTAMIENGAPVDVFLAANMSYPARLFEKKAALAAPVVYAQGQLVLWSIKREITDIRNVSGPEVGAVALADPERAPYGTAAVDCLAKLGVLDELRSKIVYGQSISQVNHFIVTGASDMGFTSKSAVLTPKNKGKGSWVEIDKTLYSPIKQGCVIVAHAPNPEGAKKFFDYLFGDKAKGIFVKYGYAA